MCIRDSLKFRFLEDSLTLDPVVLHDQYEIEPRGGMDMVSKQMLVNKALQRKQIFANSPWIDQVELDKSILELDDPSLISRLLRDPNQKSVDEQTQEKELIPALLIGENIPVDQGQDYGVRVGTLIEYLQMTLDNGTQISPQGQSSILKRLGDLLNAMEEVDTNNARALRKDVTEFLEGAGFIPSEEEVEMMQQQQQMAQMQPQPQMIEETMTEEVVM